MLLFIKCFGNGIDETLCVVVSSQTKLLELKSMLSQLRPSYIIKRYLFAGVELIDESKSLAIDYNIIKESTIQCSCQINEESRNLYDDSILPGVPSLFGFRQISSEEIQFGELILIHLIYGRNIVPLGWNGYSDPYVIFAFDGQQSRSSVKDCNLNPEWNELFGFYLSPGTKSPILSLMCFDYDIIGRDGPLGNIDIDISLIPRDQLVEKTEKLQGAKHGELTLTIRRATVTSKDLLEVIKKLILFKDPWSSAKLSKFSVTFDQLVGELPYFVGESSKKINPALLSLEKAISSTTFKLESLRTLSKVGLILQSQAATTTSDFPSRQVCIANMNMSPTDFYYHLVTLIPRVNLKRIIFNLDNSSCSIFCKSNLESLAIILNLHKISTDFKFIFKDSYDFNVKRAFGSFYVSEPLLHENVEEQKDVSLMKWNYCWIEVDSNYNLNISLKKFQNSILQLKKDEWEILSCGSYSLEIFDHNTKYSRFIKFDSALEAEKWIQILDKSYNFVSETFIQSCPICSELKNSCLLYFCEKLNSFACLSCISPRVIEFLKLEDFDKIVSFYSLSDIRDILPPFLFSQFLELGFKNALNSKSFIRCPTCTSPIEVEHHTWSTKVSPDYQPSEEIGIDSQPLSEKALNHFLTNRFQCVNCLTEFCKLCKDTPYHLGFECASYIEYKNAPKCRFCTAAITIKTLFKISNDIIENCCNNKFCIERLKESCTKKNRCTHYCGGKSNEKICPPCLHADCSETATVSHGIYQTLNDGCPICMEDLSSAPVVALNCVPTRHVFHYDCLRKKLNLGWSSVNIDFSFLKCPLCDNRVSHEFFNEIIEPFLVLEKKVRSKAFDRLRFEGLDNDKAITIPGGRFYKDPSGFALHHFAFYQCYSCKNPYYAGAKACGADAVVEVNRAELICTSCLVVKSQDSCSIHGTEWLSFKCRFCCKLSVWFCWSKTRFCEYCHSNYSNYVESCSGNNTRKYYEYENCPGLQAQLNLIKNDHSYANEDEKLIAMSKCLSDPSSCPLGIRHPPHGIEFGIGCGMCRNNNNQHIELSHSERVKLLDCLQFDPSSRSDPVFQNINKSCDMITFSRFQSIIYPPVPKELTRVLFIGGRVSDAVNQIYFKYNNRAQVFYGGNGGIQCDEFKIAENASEYVKSFILYQDLEKLYRITFIMNTGRIYDIKGNYYGKQDQLNEVTFDALQGKCITGLVRPALFCGIVRSIVESPLSQDFVSENEMLEEFPTDWIYIFSKNELKGTDAYVEWELKTLNSEVCLGLIDAKKKASRFNVSDSFVYFSNGSKTNNLQFGEAFTCGDIIGMKIDFTDRMITFYKNGFSQGTAFIDIPLSIYLFTAIKIKVKSDNIDKPSLKLQYLNLYPSLFKRDFNNFYSNSSCEDFHEEKFDFQDLFIKNINFDSFVAYSKIILPKECSLKLNNNSDLNVYSSLSSIPLEPLLFTSTSLGNILCIPPGNSLEISLRFPIEKCITSYTFIAEFCVTQVVPKNSTLSLFLTTPSYKNYSSVMLNHLGNIGVATEFYASKSFNFSSWHILIVKVNCTNAKDSYLQLQLDDFIFPQFFSSDLVDLSPTGPFVLKDSFNLFVMEDGDSAFYSPVLLRYYKLYTSIIPECIFPKSLEFISNN